MIGNREDDPLSTQESIHMLACCGNEYLPRYVGGTVIDQNICPCCLKRIKNLPFSNSGGPLLSIGGLS